MVQAATEAGYEAVKALEPQTLFLWVGKIFFGMLYRELFLPLDRGAVSSDPIVSADNMKMFQMHHYFLQSSRVPMAFECFDAEVPWTIYVFQVQPLKTHRANWDFRDDINYRTAFVRMGTLGILAAFDAGAISMDAGDSFLRYAKHPLHPLQFEELGAAFFYKASLFDRTPKLIVTETEGLHKIMIMPIAGLSTKPVFRDWDFHTFAQVLSIFTDTPLEQIHPVPGKIMTWLRQQENDEFMHLSVDKIPYRGSS